MGCLVVDFMCYVVMLGIVGEVFDEDMWEVCVYWCL